MNDEMNTLIDKAEAEGKWLHCSYQDLWFSPDELRTAQAQGRFRWGVVNWTLRNPQEYVDQASIKLAAAHEHLAKVIDAVTP